MPFKISLFFYGIFNCIYRNNKWIFDYPVDRFLLQNWLVSWILLPIILAIYGIQHVITSYWSVLIECILLVRADFEFHASVNNCSQNSVLPKLMNLWWQFFLLGGLRKASWSFYMFAWWNREVWFSWFLYWWHKTRFQGVISFSSVTTAGKPFWIDASPSNHIAIFNIVNLFWYDNVVLLILILDRLAVQFTIFFSYSWLHIIWHDCCFAFTNSWLIGIINFHLLVCCYLKSFMRWS